jgi:hypothetical protein
VAGKTGTAEKLTNGHYDKGKNIATFAGFAPVISPAAVIVISLDEPHEGGRTGGAVAALPFSEVMAETLRLLRVTPDYVPEPPPETLQTADASGAPRDDGAELSGGAAPHATRTASPTEHTSAGQRGQRRAVVPARAPATASLEKRGRRG